MLTDNFCGRAREEDLLQVAAQYLTSVKSLVPGAELRPNKTNTIWGVVKNGRSITVDALLVDDKREAGWLQAIAEFQSSVIKSSRSRDQEAEPKAKAAGKQDGTVREVVLQVGAEGGSLTLVRERTGEEDWRFQMQRNEAALYDLDSEEDRGDKGDYSSQTDYVDSFHEGLHLLDEYEWFRLYPIEVHPEFLDAILLEVKKRGDPSDETRWRERLKTISGWPLRCPGD